jgi:hypothetical protein
MNNHPEKWAESFMQNANEGHPIPFNHRLQSSNIPNLNYTPYVPANHAPANHTQSIASSLPNLKKTLKTLSSNSAAFVPQPPPPPPPPPPLNSVPSLNEAHQEVKLDPETILQVLLSGKRIYINNYPPELRDDLYDIYFANRTMYNILYHSYYYTVDGDKKMVRNPYYYISKNPSVAHTRTPLRSISQGTQRRRKTRRQHMRTRSRRR